MQRNVFTGKENENLNRFTTLANTECISGYTTSLPILLNSIIFFTALVYLKIAMPNRGRYFPILTCHHY